MSFLVNRCVKRSHVVQELYEEWQIAHREALLATDVEELCGEWLELCQLCQHAWRGLRRALYENTIDDTEGLGAVFLAAVRRANSVGGSIAGLVSELIQRGFTIAQGDRLKVCVAEVGALERDVLAKWPFLDRELILKARTAYERGEFQPLEDILHGARGASARTD